ncbi:carbon monoxide dehydrogenase subunit G [Actinoplanes lutulentus]|uniref:Carbon monoxide dehydrogenase subunit G n=1 Tax=Actinoplanes lutulentus TaxID=1287878 RepID=A0A327ZJ52_9ACTN|nr:SRPBCC family protein [Actinoplanes lutulentus]MBB2944467.1 carbon monoxide dehydrogenase subunit G [Actinoplanes lutulentus]RAK42301.1 carbon monoxide dehydrogenase subunit G [Actinoplanes lutulentus]
MKLNNEFVVHTPIDRAWQVLTDLEGIAPCMPGAQLTGVDGEVYKGRVKVKVGPVISDFAGTAQFTSKDDATYRAVIDAKGRDARSAGNAAAVVTAWLTPAGDDSTQVNVETDLKISGKLAQFGSGMIKEVSGKLLTQFVTNLEKKLANDAASAAAAAPAETGTAPAVESAEAAPTVTEPVAERGASTAAVETAPATAVALGAVAPGIPDLDTSGAPAVAPDPSAGTVAESAGRTEIGAGTPEQVAPLNVPPAELINAAESPAAEEARTETPAAASTTTPADAPADAVAAPVAAASTERKIESEEPEALDLLEVAGNSIYKRAIPVVIGVAVVAAVIVWAVARP